MSAGPADDEVLRILDESLEPLCSRCDASFRAPDDTLCDACRYEIDETSRELPGAAA